MNEDIRVYSSDSTKKKSAVKLLIIEIITLIVVLIGIVIAFIYLNVLSISDISKRIGIVNTQKQEGIISLRSLNPEYTLSLVNYDEIEDYIKKSGVLDRVYNEAGGGSEPLKTIEVVLSDTPQPNIGVFDNNQQRMASLALVFIEDRLEIHVYPDPVYASDTQRMAESISRGFSTAIRTVINIATGVDRIPIEAQFRVEN